MRNWTFVPSRALSIASKEVRHIRRDPFTLTMALGLPMFMLLFFGFAIDFDVRDIRLTVLDRDNSRPSRELVDTIRGTGLFIIHYGQGNGTDDLDHERAKATLVIDKGFSDDFRHGKSPKAQMLVDGADNESSGVIASYIAGIVPWAWARMRGESLPKPVIDLKTRLLFNGELNSRWFMIPGLGVLIMGLLATLLTATTVAREWENGSMELLLTTPVSPLEIITGKLLPYLVLGLGAVTMIYISARLIFGLPFAGSHILYFFGCLLFLIPCLAMGLVVSVATRQQQQAMQMSMMLTMLPSMMLSGFIFPVESMPNFFYYLTFIIPARWFIVISRGLYLKGMGLTELFWPLVILVIMNAYFVNLAFSRFKTDLEP